MYPYANAYNIRFRYLSKETKQAITLRRKQLGWSKSELNIRCGFIPCTIYKIEHGMMVPTIYQLTKLNLLLGLHLNYC